MTSIKRILSLLLKGIFSLLLILILASVVILALEIKVELNHLNKPVEIAVEQMLGRDFSMNGDVVLIPTLWPTLEIHDVSINNPEEKTWASGKEMMHFGRLRLQLGLLPLLSGKIYVADMIAQDITLNLESDANGKQNWDFDLASASPEKESPHKEPSAAEQASEIKNNSSRLFHLEAMEQIIFKNINVHYYEPALNKSLQFNLEQLEGKVLPGEDIDLVFNGRLVDKEFSVKLKGGSLALFRDKSQEWPLTMNMNIAGTDIELSGALQRGRQPALVASLEVGKTDIGATLSWFKVINGLQAGTEHISVKAKIQGDNLSDVIKDAELSMVLKNAWWNLEDKNTGGKLPIKITQGTITIEPQKAAQIELDGVLEQSKINIQITGAPITDYTRKELKTPLVLAIKTNNTKVTLKTKISQSMDVKNMGFNMVFTGQSLSDLNQLTRMDLPPLGPYKLQGYFGTNQKGYQIKNLLLTVKESQLKGNMLFDTQAKPPYLKVDLKSKQIKINNFDVGQWSPAEKKDDKEVKTKPEKEQKDKHKKNKELSRKLLSHETLIRYDVDIHVAVDNVLSGKDNLGHGVASLALKKARLNLNLAELKIPGGDISADFIYHPSGEKNLDIALQAKVTNFDYGILARRIDPKSEVSGLIGLDIALASKNAKDLDSLLVNSQGHLDFFWIPESLDADLFEMWAINIMSSLLKNADKDDSSKVNCVVARFALNEGKMREKVIFADTTKMRMAGTAEADFKERTIEVKVAPKAKKAQFFSLATPVGMRGHFDDFSLSINPLSLTTTVVSFITSPLHVPVRRLLNKGLPEDGLEACQAMWEVSEEVELNQ